MSILSVEDAKTQLPNEFSTQSREKHFWIKKQPIMECALDVLTIIGGKGIVSLKAKGDDIPIAVGVANVIVEKFMKNNSSIAKIILDSENGAGRYGVTLVSTIEIVIEKKPN